MPRYILIDNASGYIWGDTSDIDGENASAETPEEAARLLDESLGQRGRRYTLHEATPHETTSGYDVYRADVKGGPDVIAEIEDGTDHEAIEAVEKLCQYCGFVEFTRPGD